MVKGRDGATASRRIAWRSSSHLVSRPIRRDSDLRSPSQIVMSIEDRVGDRGNRGAWLQTARPQLRRGRQRWVGGGRRMTRPSGRATGGVGEGLKRRIVEEGAARRSL